MSPPGRLVVGGIARGETLRVTSNVAAISREVHRLDPIAEAWLNGLLLSPANEYEGSTSEVTSEPYPSPGYPENREVKA